MMQGGGRRHVGLGSTGQASGNMSGGAPQFAAASFPSMTASDSWDGQKFSLFVGNLADGVIDGWLERILGTVGTVLSIKRPTPAFAFVEYADPETVLRCLQVLDGAVLVGSGGQEKAMTVKVDQKNRERLDKYEATRQLDEMQREITERAKEELEQIVNLMRRGDAPATSSLTVTSLLGNGSNRPGPIGLRNHLADLPAEEIPEEHRGVITSEIAQFRERAAQRAREKQKQLDMQQAQQSYSRGPPPSRQWGAQPSKPQPPLTSNDPQSFNRPIGFVPSAAPQRSSSGTASPLPGPSSASTPGPSTTATNQSPSAAPLVDDWTREQDRQEKARRAAETAFRERERRFESREKHRIQAVERERAREKSSREGQERDRLDMADKLAYFDDDREAEKGRELFYTDRERWRSQRRQRRMREIEADNRDRELEAQRRATLQIESDAFLARQADDFAKMSDARKREIARTLPTNAETKLSFGAAAAKPAGPKQGQATTTTKIALGAAEDEEEEGKKRRQLIPLTYSDDEDAEDVKRKRRSAHRMTPAEKQRKARDLRDSLPRDKEALFEMRVRWSLVSDDLLEGQIKPIVTQYIAEYLGAPDDDLLTAVLDHLRARKGAAALVQELEPVLDEEATDFVRKVWFELLYEIVLVHNGLD